MKVMKKSFAIILTISLVCLVLFIGGVFFLSKDNAKSFSSDGYIISLASGDLVVDEFDEGTTYHMNLNGDIVFKNVDNNEVISTLDNFVHYSNGNINFLQNGVILDLNKITETIIPYYNITNKSVIRYTDGSYTINNVNGDLQLDNWIGKISDSKYIVAGENIALKLAGNADVVYSQGVGSFFEINYIEDGVVVISDGVTSRSTTADNTYLYIGEDIVINLGNMNVYYNDEVKLSLSQMTISGNENIEIVPDEDEGLFGDDEEPNDDGNTNVVGDENGTTPDDNTGTGTGDGQGDGQGDGDSEDDGLGDEVSITKNPTFRLLEADVTANSIDLLVGVSDPNGVIQGGLTVNITNVSTNETVYTQNVNPVGSEIEISTGSGTLTPNSNYIVSIVGDYTTEELTYEKQYFQRIFKTESLGVKLEKSYATSDSLAFSVSVTGEDMIASYDLSLYDSEDNEIETINVQVNGQNTYETLFENLDSNTEYKAVLKNITYANVTYIDGQDASLYREGDYTFTLAVKTLKVPPVLGELKAVVSDEKDSVKLSVDVVSDEEEAITKYTYYIYKYNDVTGVGDSEPTTSVESKESSSVDVAIDGEKILASQSYRFMVVVEYYDNEKYVEYETGFSDSFVAGGAPKVSYVVDADNTIFNTVSGTIQIEDNNCTVPIAGRDCFDQDNHIYVRYYKAGTPTIDYNEVEANFDPESLSYKFTASGLEANSNYIIEVYGDVDLKDGTGLKNDVQIGESMYASTTGIVPMTVNWGNERISREEQVFSLGGSKLASTNNSEVEINQLASLKIRVYASNTENIEDGKLIGEVTRQTNLKELFYDNPFIISATDTFGYDIDALKRMTDNLLTKYYIFEITDLYDSASINRIELENNIYAFEIDPDLRADDVLGDPTLIAEVLKSNNVDSSIKITANYDYDNLVKLFPDADFKLHLSVCNKATNECGSYSAANINNSGGTYTRTLAYNGGIDYYDEDSLRDEDGNIVLRRGTNYQFRYYITVDNGHDGSIDYYYPGRIEPEYVMSDIVTSSKRAPVISIKPTSSTENSITYAYTITDVDKAMYKEKDAEDYYFYYVIDGEEHPVPITFNTESTLTVEGLSNNKQYSLYYNVAMKKSGNVQADVTKGYEAQYTFDGYYDASNYELEYVLENNELSNKAVLRIKRTSNALSLINRMSAYQLVLKVDDNIIYNKAYTTLNDDTGEYIKYLDIKYSEIEDYLNKTIKVEFYGYYDNGLIGVKSDVGYLVQENSSYKGQGRYIVLDSANNIITSDVPLGIYDYQLNAFNFHLYSLIDDNNEIVTREDATTKRENIAVSNTSEGLKHGNYTINFKSLSLAEFPTSGDDEFIFYSITPDVSTSYNASINGFDVTIDNAGITDKILKDNFVVDSDGKYYFYIELYNSSDDKIETKKVEINTNGKTEFSFENLDDDTVYKYKIFAYMNKAGESYTQINDSDTCDSSSCSPVTYEVKTLAGSDLFGGLLSSYDSTSTEDNYTNHKLYLDLTLNNELTNHLKNYDLIINLIEGENVIGTQRINEEDLTSNIKVEFDITEHDTIYGTGYYKVQLLADTTVSTGDKQVTINDDFIVLEELKAPSISVTKSAETNVINDEYVYSLTFNIALLDNYKVIQNGVYNIRLLDNNNDVVKEISNVPVQDFQKVVFANKIENPDTYNVVTDLKPDREYKLEVSYQVYMNNYSLRLEAENSGSPYEEFTKRTYVYNYSIYTSGIYGVSLGSMTTNATENSIVLSLFSSSNLSRITKMDYSITQEGSSSPIASGSYLIGDGMDKTFNLINSGTGESYYSLVIDPEGLQLEVQTGYILTLQFYITDESGKYQAISTNNNSLYVTRIS